MERNYYIYNLKVKDKVLHWAHEAYPNDGWKGYLWLERYGLNKPEYFTIYRFVYSKGKLRHVYTWKDGIRVEITKNRKYYEKKCKKIA